MKLHLIKVREVRINKRVLYMITFIAGCCPIIVKGPSGSVIQPFTRYRGNVALIVNWGTCTVNDKGFKLVAIMNGYNTNWTCILQFQVLRKLG